jgi:hypothetical protein
MRANRTLQKNKTQGYQQLSLLHLQLIKNENLSDLSKTLAVMFCEKRHYKSPDKKQDFRSLSTFKRIN